jgi:hypothetical protein
VLWPFSVFGNSIGGNLIVEACEAREVLAPFIYSTFSTLPPLVVIFKWIGTVSWAGAPVSFSARSARNLSVALPSALASGNFVIDILMSCGFYYVSFSIASNFSYSCFNYFFNDFFSSWSY